MKRIFKEKKLDINLNAFFDDNILSGKSRHAVDEALKLTINELKKAKFVVNEDKTIYACEEIEWLGFIVKQGAIRISEK